MGRASIEILIWLHGLSINWDAVAAVATIAATLVALFLPMYQARREWARQDQRDRKETKKEKKKLKEAAHEVCSAVDRILAYREVTIALFQTAPPYPVALQAIEHITLNTQILLDVLDLLKGRPELSDGAVFSAVAGRSIADAIVKEASPVVAGWGVDNPFWQERKARLEKLDRLAGIAQERTDGVRKHYRIKPSGTAQQIRDKYLTLSAAMAEALATNGELPPNTVGDTYY